MITVLALGLSPLPSPWQGHSQIGEGRRTRELLRRERVVRYLPPAVHVLYGFFPLSSSLGRSLPEHA